MDNIDNIDKITAERGDRYGPFSGHAAITRNIKDQFKEAYAVLDGRQDLAPDTKAAIKEGYDMIAHKIGRAMNGDIAYLDNLDDIAGYAKITAKAIRDNAAKGCIDTNCKP